MADFNANIRLDIDDSALSDAEKRLKELEKERKPKVNIDDADISSVEQKLKKLEEPRKIKVSLELDKTAEAQARDMAKSIQRGLDATKLNTDNISERLAGAFNINTKGITGKIKSQLDAMISAVAKTWDGTRFDLTNKVFGNNLNALVDTVTQNAKVLKQKTGLYDAFYDYFKNKKIYISDDLKFGMNTDLYKEISNMNIGKIVRDATKGISLDSIWEEMTDLFPEHFAKDVTNQVDQVVQAFDILRRAREDVAKSLSFADLTTQEQIDLQDLVSADVVSQTQDMLSNLRANILNEEDLLRTEFTVGVRADTGSLIADIQSAINTASATAAEVKINLDIDPVEVKSKIDNILSGISANNTPININVDIDRQSVEQDIRNAVTGIDLPIEITVDADNLEQQIRSAISAIDDVEIDVHVNADDMRNDIRNQIDADPIIIPIDFDYDMSDIRDDLDNLNRRGREGNDIFSAFGGTMRDAFSAYTLANLLERGIDGVVEAGKEAITIVKELDDMATDLQMATGLERSDVKDMIVDYRELGNELSTLTLDVAKSADEWLRQGKTQEETNTLIKDSIVLSKVGQIESAEATEYLTTAMKGYHVAVEDVSKITDKLSAVDMVSATSAGELAEAMSKTATGADLAGISMDRLIAMIATVAETSGKSASTVGNSFQTVFSRMRDLQDGNLSSIGEDGVIEDLSKVEVVLGQLDIKLRDSNLEFRNFQEVLDEVSLGWNTYSSVQQAAIAEAFAGTRQSENFFIMMENYDRVREYTQVAMNSLGTAEAKFQDAYLSSLEAKTNQLRNSLEALATDTITDGLYEGFLDGATAASEFARETDLVKTAIAGLGSAGATYALTNLVRLLQNTAIQVTALGGGFTGLWRVMASHPVLLVASAVTMVAGAFNAYNAKMDEAVASAKQAGEAFTENITDIEEYSSKITELRTALDSGTLSEQEAYAAKSELLSIQQALSESYGSQIEGINLINGSLAEQIDLLNELTVAEANRYLNENQTGIKQATKKMENEEHYFLGDFSAYHEDAKAIQDIVSKYANRDIYTDEYDGTIKIHLKADAVDAEETLNDFMTDIRNASSEASDIDLFNNFTSYASGNLEEVNKVLERYQDVYDKAQNAQLIADIRTFDGKTAAEWLNNYTDAVKEYNEAIYDASDSEAINQTKQNYKEVQQSVTELLSTEHGRQYKAMFEEVGAELDELAIKSYEFNEGLSGKGTNGWQKHLKLVADEIKSLEMDDVDFEAAVDDKSIDSINYLSQAAEQAGISTDELIASLVEFGYITGGEAFTAVQEGAKNLSAEIEEVIGRTSLLQERINDINANPQFDAISEALDSKNAGSDYEDAVGYLKKAKDLYDQGLVGTDDFKSIASYISPSGADDPVNFAENYGKAARYLTDDISGVKNFLTDLEEKGYASLETLADGTQKWTYDIEDLEDASQNMGMGFEFFMDMFGRLEDYGFSNNFVSSVEDGAKRITELSTELVQEQAKLTEMEALGYDTSNKTAIDAQREKVNLLKADIEATKEAMFNLVAGTAEDYNAQIESAKTAITSLAEERQRILSSNEFGENTEIVAEMMQAQIEQWAADNHIQLDAELNIIEGSGTSETVGIVEEIKGFQELGEISPTINIDFDAVKMSAMELKDILEQLKEERVEIETSASPEALESLDELIAKTEEEYFVHLNAETDGGLDKASAILSLLNEELTTLQEQNPVLSIQGIAESSAEVSYYIEELAKLPSEIQTAIGIDDENVGDIDGIVQQLQDDAGSISIPLLYDPQNQPELTEQVVYTADYSQMEDAPEKPGTANYTPDWSAITNAPDAPGTAPYTGDFSDVGTPPTLYGRVRYTGSFNVNGETYSGSSRNYHTGTVLTPARVSGTAYNVMHSVPVSSAFASGKVALEKDEYALVNELPDGPESIIRDGVWRILPDKMHMEHLKKNDIILNAKQTRELLRYGKTNSHARAYASGTLPDGYLSNSYASGLGGGVFQGGAAGIYIGSKAPKSNTNSSNTINKYAQQATNSIASAAESVEDLVDWIKILLEQLQSKTDSYIQKAENAIKLSSSLNYYQKAIQSIGEQIAANEAGAVRYQKQADAVGLSSSLVSMVKNGTIDINEYGESTREKIQEYEKWLGLARDCTQAVEDLKQQQIELAQTKLDTIIDKYELLKDTQDSYLNKYEAELSYRETAGYSNTAARQKKLYSASITREENIISRNEQAARAIYNEMQSQLETGLMAEGDDRWREMKIRLEEYTTAIYESKSAIAEWEQAIRQIKISKIQRALDVVTRWGDQLVNIIGLKKARGQNITEADYMSQVTANNDQIYQNNRLLNQYIEEQANYEYGSEKWDEYAEKIADCKNETLELLTANEELKDSIVEERWEEFDLLQQKVENSVIELDYLRNMLDDSVDSTGNLTVDGQANIAIIGQAITLEKQTISDYNKSLQKLAKELKKGNISQEEYNEKQLDFQSIIRESVSAVEDYEKELQDLWIEQVESKNSVLQEDISLWKKATEAKDEYYSYEKSLKKQRKAVDALRSEIAALTGVTSASGKALLSKKQAELAEAKEELDDIKYQHQVQLSITGFDNLAENVDKQLELVKTELETNAEMQQNVVNLMLENIKTGYATASMEIENVISDTGLVMSDMTTAAISGWNDLTNAVKLASDAMKSANEYKASSTASSIDSSKITTNKTSQTSSTGKTITTTSAEKNATAKENTSNSAADKGSSATNALVTATKLEMNKSSLSLTIGATGSLSVSVTPTNATTELTWKTNNAKIATVSGGTVTAVAKGSATITVTDARSGKSTTCKVTVKKAKATSASTANKTTASSTDKIWKNVKQDTSMKGNKSLDIDTSIVDRMKYNGYASDKSARTQLFKNLGGSGSYTGSATQNAWMLQKLKQAGYSKGGVVGSSSVKVNDLLRKAMISSGDEGLAFLSSGETVLTEKFTELLPTTVNTMQHFNQMFSNQLRDNLRLAEEAKSTVSNVVNINHNAPMMNVEQVGSEVEFRKQFDKCIKEYSRFIVNEHRKLT